ncbi:hypothetical protein BST50_04400 [Vibrio vulnificus]|uniref:PTS sugar transporter subunit IIA n=1 Tax=Vibrio vulnificus TaxID=672 RepID=UPI000BA870F9|nr:PTS sugar transporter subunit IIA [Vibrio vulnificus]PAO30001.1 hypothetical protein BST49_20785 [Vibrio vulnificus]PAO42423.1 hypothetical protein BST50_04400 [Vibrio vulnificus]PAO47212.1 hypothetical protein BST53_06830 [Vibrio vulnificus]PAO50872.1 hypothetical protein BST54_05270 [Vibrio vulnificus]PAO59140.1 hypothetical protein BST57_08125 [Vibrio vulnificus]
MLTESRTFKITKTLTSDELITILANSLIADGLAKESYLEAVLNREIEHPTGIDCGDYAIATPHTDNIHANKPGLAVAVLNDDVIFMNADKSGQELKPSIVVMICIPPSEGGEEHIKTIGRIYGIAGNEEVVKQLSQSESTADIVEIFTRNF